MPTDEPGLFETMVGTADLGLVALDADLRVVAWNPWMESAAGVVASEALGRRLDELFPNDNLIRLSSAARAALSSGAARLLSHGLHKLPKLRTRGGRPMTYDLSLAPLGHAPFKFCLVQILDVTVAKERERVLRSRQNARYASVVDHASDGILTMDEEGRIQNSNPAATRALGFEGSELVDRSAHELLADGDLWRTLWDAALSGQAVAPVELGVRLKGDQLTYLEVSASRWRDQSGVVVSVILRDVNERHAAGEAMAQLNALNHAQLESQRDTAKLREQFIAVLGHDLRNPLAGTLGGIRLLRREAQSEKAVHVLDMMDDTLERMGGLIDNVLDFARGRLGGGISLERRRIALAPLLEQIVAELISDRPDRRIDTEIELPDDLHLDAGRIGQLVSNLLGNALTHGESSEPVILQASVSDGELVVAITNQGAPISEAAMARLFQPFFRGEVRPSQQGLGLGLHIASEIARAHGGSLEVRSSLEGTTFTFRMPIIPPEA